MGFSFAIPNFESSGDIMRNPNGYGTVAKLSGQRRRPYIVKKTIGWNDKGHPIYDIIGYAETREAGNIMLAEYNRDPWVDTVLILLYSGWRISEFLNLKPEDIDLKEGTMKGGTKTKAGKNRIVPIHPKIRPLIERRLAEGGPRLISYNGKICNQTQYRIFWADIMKALKLNHTPHECRHTFEPLSLIHI